MTIGLPAEAVRTRHTTCCGLCPSGNCCTATSTAADCVGSPLRRVRRKRWSRRSPSWPSRRKNRPPRRSRISTRSVRFAARPRAGDDVRLGDPQGTPRSARAVDARSRWCRPGRSARTRCWSIVMAGGVNYNGVWAGLRHSGFAARRPRASVHIAGSDASGIVWAVGRKCGAGRSATRSSFTAIRTTATTRSATAATRYCRRRNASGATRRRTARSRSSAGCSRAS